MEVRTHITFLDLVHFFQILTPEPNNPHHVRLARAQERCTLPGVHFSENQPVIFPGGLVLPELHRWRGVVWVLYAHRG